MCTRSRFHAFCLLLSLTAFAANPLHAQNVLVGDSLALGNGFAHVWIETDNDGVPVRVGTTIDKGLLSDLPGQVQQIWLRFPDAGEQSLWQVVLLDWNPVGHAPLFFTEPHFDFHFAIVPRFVMDQIQNGVHEVPVDPDLIPPDYAPESDPPFAVANMGVHYADQTAPEQNGEIFDKTLIYGFYNGELLFMEPMITRIFFLANRTDTLAIKQPKTFARPGYYPTNYAIEFDAATNQHHIVLMDFVFRQGMATALENPGEFPGIISLEQNYPNPFNPTTTIRYDLPEAANVQLAVFDALGRRVAELVNGQNPPGRHEVVWDATGWASGVYFYRLKTGDFVQSKVAYLSR